MKAILIAFAAPALFAQQFQTRLGTEAVDFQGGVIYNGDGRAYDAVATKLRGGLNRYLSWYGDYAYSRLLNESLNSFVRTELRKSIMDYGGGGEVHLSGRRFQPYLLAGMGAARMSTKVTIDPTTVTVSEYHFASSLGGGVRLFATPHVGFSIEARTVSIPATSSRYERYVLGIFYQRQYPKWPHW